jgi:hypothetical protein
MRRPEVDEWVIFPIGNGIRVPGGDDDYTSSAGVPAEDIGGDRPRGPVAASQGRVLRAQADVVDDRTLRCQGLGCRYGLGSAFSPERASVRVSARVLLAFEQTD